VSSVGVVHEERRSWMSSFSNPKGEPKRYSAISSHAIDLSIKNLEAMDEGQKIAGKLTKQSYSAWLKRWNWNNVRIEGEKDIPYLMRYFNDNKAKGIPNQHLKIMLQLAAVFSTNLDFLDCLFIYSLSRNMADAEDFESYIVGLLSHKEVGKAFEVSNEMSRRHMKGSLQMYNKLLAHVMDVQKNFEEQWNRAEQLLKEVKKWKIRPDRTTCNTLMKLISTCRDKERALSLWFAVEEQLHSKLGIKLSLACYFYLLQIIERHPNISSKQWLDYAIGIMRELENKNIALDHSHPDDSLFFPKLMSRLDPKVMGGKIDEMDMETAAALREGLFDYVVDNKLQHLTDKSFFLSYFLNLVDPDSVNISMDEIFHEYTSMLPYVTPMDRTCLNLLPSMLDHMASRKHIHHLPHVVADILAIDQQLFPKDMHKILNLLVENGGVVTDHREHPELLDENGGDVTDHREHLELLEYVHSNLVSTREVVSQYIYCLLLWGEHSRVEDWLDQCQCGEEDMMKEVVLEALRLAQKYDRADLTSNLLKVSDERGLGIQLDDLNEITKETTLTLKSRESLDMLASHFGCSKKGLIGKTLKGYVASRIKEHNVYLDFNLGSKDDLWIKKADLPLEINYLFSPDLEEGEILRKGHQFECSIIGVEEQSSTKSKNPLLIVKTS